MQHAGPGPGLIDAVLTGAQEERLLQRVQRAGNGIGACERSEIVALVFLGATVFQDLRRCMVAADEDVREALVVAQDNVEAWFELFDQVGFEEESLGLCLGHHEFHAGGEGDHQRDALRMPTKTRVIGDAVFQVLRFADIEDFSIHPEHAVNARLGR